MKIKLQACDTHLCHEIQVPTRYMRTTVPYKLLAPYIRR